MILFYGPRGPKQYRENPVFIIATIKVDDMDDTKTPSSIESESVDIEKQLGATEGRVLLDDIKNSEPDDFLHEVTTPLPAQRPFKRIIVKRIRKRRVGGR